MIDISKQFLEEVLSVYVRSWLTAPIVYYTPSYDIGAKVIDLDGSLSCH